MLAVAGFRYDAAYELVVKWTAEAAVAGRQLAHAMAHGSYTCKKYSVIYDEASGTFGLLHQ